MGEYKAFVVWVDQGMGHGHIELKTFEDEVEKHSMTVDSKDELHAIRLGIEKELAMSEELILDDLLVEYGVTKKSLLTISKAEDWDLEFTAAYIYGSSCAIAVHGDRHEWNYDYAKDRLGRKPRTN